ncbi:MAG: glycosyltransferase family 2 protein [Pirellulales bacterium]|nr:glycosyltransferase family 2 protein [Pirellulales bacterium]
MRISVVIPAYNASRHIHETLDSVLAQTFTDYEIIVIDDGSTDHTPEILKQYGANITVVRQTNRGRAAACNAGVRIARGEWIALVDADDVWLPEKLEQQVVECGNYAMSYTDSVTFGENCEEVVKSLVTPAYSGYVVGELLLGNFITGSSVVIRKDVFLEEGGFDESYCCVQDWPLWLKICAKHELGYLAEPVVRYRIHDEATSANARRTVMTRNRVLREAFGPGGVGEPYRHLRRAAYANSYLVGVHYAGMAGNGGFATSCALHAVLAQPTRQANWKWLAKALSIAMGFNY